MICYISTYRLSSALIRIKLDREDLNNQVAELSNQLSLANEKAKQAEELILTLTNKQQDLVSQDQLASLKSGTKMIKVVFPNPPYSCTCQYNLTI